MTTTAAGFWAAAGTKWLTAFQQTGADAANAGKPIVDKGFAQITRITPDIYVTIADMSKGPQAVSNGGFIVGRDGVLIIEGHLQPEAAALELETARSVSKAPIRGAVNTHYHFDHTFGNSHYQTQSVRIIAHEQVAPLMKTAYGGLKGKDTAAVLAPYEAKVAAAKDPIEREHAQSDLNAWKILLSSINATTLTYPTETVKSGAPMKIDLGGVTAVLEHSPGHSPTDLLITIPERDVIFTGDLVFNGMYPVAFDSQILAWREIVDRLSRANKATRFIPGHGPLCDVDAIRTMADVMEDLRAHAERMMKAGASADEAQKRYTVPAQFKSFGIFSWGFTVGAAMEKYYAELQKG